jgi:hypothetical protein
VAQNSTPGKKMVGLGDPISSFGGFTVFREFLQHIKFNQLLLKAVRFVD